MANRIGRLFDVTTETLRVIGTAMAGVMPALRSPDGTYGTQRAQSRQRAQERDRKYPHG